MTPQSPVIPSETGPDDSRRTAIAAALLADWTRAEAGCAARLARTAAARGALADRLHRGPEGWRHRLAVIEAAEIGWFAGDRVSPDRLALWMALHLARAQEDGGALARVAWAARRLSGGAGPEADLAAFLDRRDPRTIADHAERFTDRAAGWCDLMAAAQALHPVKLENMQMVAPASVHRARGGTQQQQQVAAVIASRHDACQPCGLQSEQAACLPDRRPAKAVRPWASGIA